MQIQEIESALKSLEFLLASGTAQESDYQAFFEENPAAFAALGYTNFHPHLALRTTNGDLIPDFFVRRCCGNFEICEIKTPEERLLKETKSRTEFYAKLSSEYAAQMGEYAEFFDDEANRSKFKQEHGIDVPKRPRKSLIVGRSENLDRFELHKLLARRAHEFDLITYDDVVSCLRSQLELLRFGAKSRFGVTISMVIRVLPNLTKTPQYILDYFEPSSSERLSLILFPDGDLRFGLQNSERRTETYFVARIADSGSVRWRHIQFALGSSERHCRIELRENGAILEARELPQEFYRRQALEYSIIRVGSDHEGLNGAAFDLSFLRIFNFFLGLGEQNAEDEMGRQRIAAFGASPSEPLIHFEPQHYLGMLGCKSGEEPKLEAYYDARQPEGAKGDH